MTLTNVLGVLTLLGNLFIVGTVAALLYEKVTKKKCSYFSFFKEWGLHMAFIVLLSGMLGSLAYSELIGFEPCLLCWWARIFMYPQVILLGLALWKKDKSVVRYVMPLTVIGTLVGAYHYVIQNYLRSAAPCTADAVSCGAIYFKEFGYITMPMMGLTAFVLAGVLYWIVAYRK